MKVKIHRELDNTSSLIDEVKRSSNEIGAIAVFIGVVRGVSYGERVLRLEYEAHEVLAEKVMEKIIEESKDKYGIIDAIVEHKIGSVGVGEDVMKIVVASRHRRECFKALMEIVDRVKHEVPIWKKEVTEKRSYWDEGSEN